MCIAGDHSLCAETVLFEQSSNRTRQRVNGGAEKFRFIAIRGHVKIWTIIKTLFAAANLAHFWQNVQFIFPFRQLVISHSYRYCLDARISLFSVVWVVETAVL